VMLLQHILLQYLPGLLFLHKALVSAVMPLFEMNNAAVRNSLLKYNQTDPSNESTFRKNYYLRNMKKEETLDRIVVL
jgi:hypothetical protein